MGKRPEGNRELYKYIGHQIKLARLDNTPARLDGQKSPSAMTQTTLANAVGVTFQQIQKYEKATNKVPIDRLIEIGLKTKRDITYFLPRSVEESSNPLEDLKKILVLTEDMEVK